jgi:regulator of nucleoside diphosphate kinase
VLLTTEVTSVHDKERLSAAIERALGSWLTFAPYLQFFRTRLRGIPAVPPTEVPDDAITMNSRFVVRNDATGDTASYTLVFPEDEAPLQRKVSALSPMGMALFGARVGEEIAWMSAAGMEVATITKLLYQPEAAGDYHL